MKTITHIHAFDSLFYLLHLFVCSIHNLLAALFGIFTAMKSKVHLDKMQIKYMHEKTWIVKPKNGEVRASSQ